MNDDRPFWQHLFLGTAPVSFTLEVMLRTLFVYLCLLFAVRILGKRMSGQVTVVELAVMLALGAIVSGAMQLRDHGVVIGVVSLAWLTLLQFLFSRESSRAHGLEKTLVGRASVLVRDGIVLPRELERARISQQQLFSVLRSQQVLTLGEIERVYLEACGAFSLLRRKQPLPGLSVLPPAATGLAGKLAAVEPSVCGYCGAGRPARAAQVSCPNCAHEEWVAAVHSNPGES